MIQLVDKDKCSGCSACYNACKTGALVLKVDKTGFWFPKIDNQKCVECRRCVQVCPAIKKNKYSSDYIKAFVVQNKDNQIRRQSTSGGAFTGIARQVIAQNGIVFGAAIDENFKVSHKWIEKESDIALFRNSKYVQSWIGNAYNEAELFLKEGRLVCFSGTPCQIYGLKQYLGRDYLNLLTVDVMCRAVPSPRVLQKYLDYQREKYPNFDKIIFRNKIRGYSYSCVTLLENNKILYTGGSESDPWLRLFLGGYCNRKACHNCIYQNEVRASDITLWDCWKTHEYAPEWDDNKGTTSVITWNIKGLKYIQNPKSNLRFKEIEVPKFNREVLPKAQYNYQKFYSDLKKDTPKKFIKKYAPTTGMVLIKKFSRYFIYKLHIHNLVRNTVHYLRKRKR